MEEPTKPTTHIHILDLDADALQSILTKLGAKDLANLAAINFVPGLIVDVLQQRAPTGSCEVRQIHITHTSAFLRTEATKLARLEWRRTEAHMPVAACTTSCTFATQHGQLMTKRRDFYAEFGHELWLQSHDGTLTPITSQQQPQPLDGTEGIKCTNVYHRNKTFVAISTSGRVYTWSDENSPSPIQTPHITRILSIAIGINHILAVAENGDVYSWGQDNAGKLGYIVHAQRNAPPRYIAQPRRIETLRGISARCASAGNNHSLVVTEEGKIYTFGYVYGQYTSRVARFPEKIDAHPLCNLRITSTAAGSYHSLAVTQEGMVLSWGYDHGQLGRPRKGRIQETNIGTQEISFIPLRGTVRSVAASYDTSCAVTTDGKLFVWGRHYGNTRPFSRGPKIVDALRHHTVTTVSIDKNHIVVLTQDYRVIGMDLPHALSPHRRFIQCN
jgi:hypothetical protein